MIIDKVRSTIVDHDLIQKGDKIVLGLSGGPDSVCLLHILKSLKDELNIEIYAAHLNHQIRGLEAQKDAMYVSKLCDELDIIYFVKSIDVPTYCKDHGLSIEEGARILRYEMFFQIKEKTGANKIAIAHNLNDQAETVLMRIMRGTGLQGLKGISYKREDGIIRPLIDIHRDEIERYCEVNNLNPRIDESNLESVYTRNKIRLELIPYMKENFNPNITDALVRMSHTIKEDNDYIDIQCSKAFEEVCERENENINIYVESFHMYHKSIKSRIIRKSINYILGDLKGIEQKHIDDVLEMEYEDKLNKKINLPRGIIVYRNKSYISITNKEIVHEDVEYCYNIPTNGYIKIKELNMVVESKILNIDKIKNMKSDKNAKLFDVDKVEGGIVIRNRKPGDKIRISGLGGNKKIKDLFIDLKIPKEQRNNIPIMADQNGIMCVGIYRDSESYKVDTSTKEVLKICFKYL